jgi:hypothetical protein
MFTGSLPYLGLGAKRVPIHHSLFLLFGAKLFSANKLVAEVRLARKERLFSLMTIAFDGLKNL